MNALIHGNIYGEDTIVYQGESSQHLKDLSLIAEDLELPSYLLQSKIRLHFHYLIEIVLIAFSVTMFFQSFHYLQKIGCNYADFCQKGTNCTPKDTLIEYS